MLSHAGNFQIFKVCPYIYCTVFFAMVTVLCLGNDANTIRKTNTIV